MKKIAIICTGRELLNGKIHESNSHYFAKLLNNLGIHLESIIIAGDDLIAIETAIRQAGEKADCLIISGGLGPTSDDLTRFAFAAHIGEDLHIDLPSLEHIKQRLTSFKLNYSESNKQQSLFPIGAQIIHNAHGTANGCFFHKANKDYFLLPGPPQEAFPIFESYVLNKLIELGYGSNNMSYVWRLIGPSESIIAPQLDDLVKNYEGVQTGFCYAYPYLDFILYCDKDTDYDFSFIDDYLKEYLVNKTGRTASAELGEKLNFPITIIDTATGGLFYSSVITPINRHFLNDPTAINAIEISGLDEFWRAQKPEGTTEIKITITMQDASHHIQIEPRYRGEEVRKFAVEFAASHLLKIM